MSNIWLDPFGISLIKNNPPPPPPPAPPAAKEPKVQVQYTLPCYPIQMPQQVIFYNVNSNAPFCNHGRPVPHCHCQHMNPNGKKTDGQKKPADKKPVDNKKKKKEEEQKKKKDRMNVQITFNNPRPPRKGIFEP